jgi:hypothetical protein
MTPIGVARCNRSCRYSASLADLVLSGAPALETNRERRIVAFFSRAEM